MLYLWHFVCIHQQTAKHPSFSWVSQAHHKCHLRYVSSSISPVHFWSPVKRNLRGRAESGRGCPVNVSSAQQCSWLISTKGTTWAHLHWQKEAPAKSRISDCLCFHCKGYTADSMSQCLGMSLSGASQHEMKAHKFKSQAKLGQISSVSFTKLSY